MSTGMVVCSICHCECHQRGDKSVQRGWVHCDDRTALCHGATVVYPRDASEVRGKYCACDGPLPKGGTP